MATRHTSRPKVPRSVREPQMLDEAVRVFADRGYHGASMADIASGVGVTKPMVYAYFGSKDELYLRSMEHAGARLREAMDIPRGADDDPESVLWKRLLAFFRFVGEHRDEWLVLRREAASSGGPFTAQLAAARERLAALVLSQFEEWARLEGAAPGADLEAMAYAMVGAGESLADWWVDNPGESAEGIALRLMNMVWLGFAELGRGKRWTPPQ